MGLRVFDRVYEIVSSLDILFLFHFQNKRLLLLRVVKMTKARCLMNNEDILKLWNLSVSTNDQFCFGYHLICMHDGNI